MDEGLGRGDGGREGIVRCLLGRVVLRDIGWRGQGGVVVEEDRHGDHHRQAKGRVS